jgi:hypothetical protein
MPPVIGTRLRFKGKVRAKIRECQGVLATLVVYNLAFPYKGLFDVAGTNAIATLGTELAAALAATDPRRG